MNGLSPSFYQLPQDLSIRGGWGRRNLQLFFSLPGLDRFYAGPVLYWIYLRKGDRRTMNDYSMRLAALGAMIGVLTLSAAAYANVSAAARIPDPPAITTQAPAAPPQTGEAAEALAPAVCYAALRLESPVRGQLCLCDLSGSPLSVVEPDEDGDAALGPVAPGRYCLTLGSERIGSFRVLENAAITETAGRLWTDGELLHLERFRPGQAELTLTVLEPGYESIQLVDDLGRAWNRDFFIPEREHRGQDGVYTRVLLFQGLPEGRYTLVRDRRPLEQFQVLAGGTVRIKAKLP